MTAQAKPLPMWRRPLREQLQTTAPWLISATAALILVLLVLNHYVVIGPNLTGSLPESIFVILKNGKMPERGGYVGFFPGPNRYYADNSFFVKRLVGLPGDTVTYVDGVFHVNGVAVAKTKPTAKDGQALVPGPVGVLPECRYFVATDHPDGYDSRYQDIGWVGCHQIVGTAYAFP